MTPDRIHILGASGSGVSTLGANLAQRYGHVHLDVDHYFWEPSDPPFQRVREVPARQALLAAALDQHRRWVLSGSLCRWGNIFIPRFELAIFLFVPHELRMARLRERERLRFGEAIEPGGVQHKTYQEFIAWAEAYDTADDSIRSRRLHERWMETLPCRCVRLEGALSVDEQLARLAPFLGEE